LARIFRRPSIHLNPLTGLPYPPLLVRISQQLAQLSPGRTLLWSLAMSLAIAFTDHATNYSMGFSRFHIIPVALVSWSWGRGPGIAMAGYSLAVWTVGERIRAPWLFIYLPVWNAFVRSVFLLAAVFVLSALREALEQEKAAARTDFLTGVANRRYFFEIAYAEIRRARRYGRPFIVAYLDIDEFKAINDRFGHNQGDALLRQVAQTIQKSLRAVDVVARLGGDEFSILFPETDGVHALSIMRKVQMRLAEKMEEMKWPVTFSIGTVAYATPPVSVDEMVKTADTLMYSVKRGGKGRMDFVVAGAPPAARGGRE
jgi:diguanylate cyclase (GGDEF)-like protein